MLCAIPLYSIFLPYTLPVYNSIIVFSHTFFCAKIEITLKECVRDVAHISAETQTSFNGRKKKPA